MQLIALIVIAGLAAALGVYPAVRHRLTFRKHRREQRPADAVQGLGESMCRAHRSVIMLCGELNPLVFNPLAPLIGREVRSKPGLRIRIVASRGISGLTPAGSNHTVNRLYDLVIGGDVGAQLQLRLGAPTEDQHFVVIDGATACIEEAHTEDAVVRKVSIYDNSAFTAFELEGRFEEIWQQAHAITPDGVEVTPHHLEESDPQLVQDLMEEAYKVPVVRGLVTA